MTRIIRSQSIEADALTGYRKSARAATIADGLLPPPIRLGGKATGFLAHELDAVIRARSTGADDSAIRELVNKLIAERANKQAA